MRLKQIELSGFRGFKNKTTIPFARGFTIITGRNGSGKSSICDALEYVLTRRLSRFAPSDVEGGEHIDDYIWWRDGSHSSTREVKAVFELDDGTTGERTATPTSISSTFEERSFYDTRSYPPDPLSLLSQTMLIRDESIVKFSTDLPEADRFDFFYRAIGLTDLARIERRANSLLRQLKTESDSLEIEYRKRREAVAQVISEISEARTVASQTTAPDMAAALNRLADLTESPSDAPLRQLVQKSNRAVAEQKQRAQALERLNTSLSQSVNWRQQLKELETKRDQVKVELDTARLALEKAADARIRAANKLREAQARTPHLSALAQLKEYGSRINLQEGRCPLCGSLISPTDFDAHLRQIQSLIETQDRVLSDLTTEEASRSAQYDKLRSEFQAKSIEYSRALSDCETLLSAMRQLESEATTLGVKLDSRSIEQESQRTRNRLAELQGGLLQLEGSSALDRIANLEKQRVIAQAEAERITRQIDLLSRAAQDAKSAADTTKRISWESVDDCLAALSPLLSELFLRLKPHVDYSEVRYHMRGDVKRFLSFEIGNGINPRFIFSSGQRRVLGLAFLLAVHLSRPWCKLPTLVLDDPVQHIDDYRALHFAEVLSSIRQLGHQVICTVQDSSLADLLCRRLRSADLGDGVKIEMVYEPGMGATIKSMQSIEPLPDRILLTA
jgi:chromosome segregation protein